MLLLLGRLSGPDINAACHLNRLQKLHFELESAVSLDIDKLPLIEHLKSQEAYTAFVKVIEERIRNDQYDDPGKQGMVKEMRENAGWKKNLNVVRIVAGLENKPLFSWNPPH